MQMATAPAGAPGKRIAWEQPKDERQLTDQVHSKGA